jgi:mRNA interferase HigB
LSPAAGDTTARPHLNQTGSIYGNLEFEDHQPLNRWANAAQAAAWKNPGTLKADFGSADFVDDLTVFNVGGHKYRLIAFVHYRRQIVYIKQILTHEEYDEGKWKR